MLEGVYTGYTLTVCPFVCQYVHPSVRLWTESCPLCIFHNTSQIHFIFTHLINQLQKLCRMLIYIKKFHIFKLEILQNVFTSSCSCTSCSSFLWTHYGSQFFSNFCRDEWKMNVKAVNGNMGKNISIFFTKQGIGIPDYCVVSLI